MPHDVLYRPKMGFAVPLARWFRGPLRQRVREAVLGERLAATGWFNRDYLQRLVERHSAGARDYSAPLWTLLMFDAFLAQRHRRELRSPPAFARRAASDDGLRILHILDHSIPLQSGYTFRTRAILREQRTLGWETFHLTSPKHTAPSAPQEEVDGLDFYRTPSAPGRWTACPIVREIALMQRDRARACMKSRSWCSPTSCMFIRRC